MEKYYLAYNKRYKQVHNKGFAWEIENDSQIVIDTINKYNISKHSDILELGVGEGRDSIFLLKKGYNILGIDCSQEAINYCKKKALENNLKENSFCVLDVLKDKLEKKFDFIYSIAVLHILCENQDRQNFLKFIKEHLKPNGKALISVMGDGKKEYTSDYENAFEDSERVISSLNKVVTIARTSLKVVNQNTFLEEITKSKLKIIEYYITEKVESFSSMMVAVVEN